MKRDHRNGRPSAYWSVCLLGLTFLMAAGLALAAAGEESQRALFLKAEQALKQNRLQQFADLEHRLKDYPLLPYLELERLQRKLAGAQDKEVKAFLDKHRGDPVADILRRQWLDHLADRKRWKSYLAFYTPQSNVRRQCNHLQALIDSGHKSRAWPLVQEMWLYGHSRPRACDPAFKAWEAAGRLNEDLTWQRIELAMDAGEWQLARFLGKKLNDTDRSWVQRWIHIHRNPKSLLGSADFGHTHPYREIMLAHAVRRLARFDGTAALQLWNKLKDAYPFTPVQRAQVERRIAVALELDDSDEAYTFINGTDPAKDDLRLHVARFKAALARQDWPLVEKRLKEWPAKEQETDRWQYWYATALTHTGQQRRAEILFRNAAKNRSYYGFLAADQIDAPYHLQHKQTPEDKFTRVRLERLPGVKRALELHALNRNVEARREWQYVTGNLKNPELRAAALVAKDKGWLDQAIFTLARTGYWDDLKLRFPLKYRNLVASEAKSNTLDMSWIYAVIRQESAFMRDAHSPAGAMGLMQLMPATARTVARNVLKRGAPAKSEILRPSLNIALGSAYLKQLKQRLDGNPVLATAAYNAGPHRVSKWLPANDLSADIWVELVPYTETRRYLKRVLSYMVIYDKRLGREPKRLKERMKPIVSGQDIRIAGA